MISHTLTRDASLRTRPPRRGISLIELTVAVMLLGVVFASLGPMLSWIRQQRRTAADRQLAQLELANAAERLSLVPYDDLTADSLSQVQIPAEAAAELPQAALTARLETEANPTAKRVTLQLTWTEDRTRTVAPLELVIWRYPAAEVQP